VRCDGDLERGGPHDADLLLVHAGPRRHRVAGTSFIGYRWQLGGSRLAEDVGDWKQPFRRPPPGIRPSSDRAGKPGPDLVTGMPGLTICGHRRRAAGWGISRRGIPRKPLLTCPCKLPVIGSRPPAEMELATRYGLAARTLQVYKIAHPYQQEHTPVRRTRRPGSTGAVRGIRAGAPPDAARQPEGLLSEHAGRAGRRVMRIAMCRCCVL